MAGKCLHIGKVFSVSLSVHSERRLRLSWGWERHSQNNWARLIHVIFLVMSHLAIKYQGKEEEGEMVVIDFYLPKPALWMLRPCLPDGGWVFACWWKVLSEFLFCFAFPCFECADFTSSIKLPFPWFISLLAILKNSPYPTREVKEWKSSRVYMLAIVNILQGK